MKKKDAWLNAADAAARLGISRATLYAYVSRGFIRSEAAGGTTRARRYSRDDVERLKQRSEERRDPRRAAEHALQWGLPILQSAITLIHDGDLFYRGQNVASLVTSRTVEETASLIWTGAFDAKLDWTARSPRATRLTSGLSFIGRAQTALPAAAAADRASFDLRPTAVARTGAHVLSLLARIAAESDFAGTAGIAAGLASAWAPRQRSAEVLLSAALILTADHELNVSSFTARCVASAGSSPYDVVIAGLCAMEGVKHGGVTLRVSTLVDELLAAPDMEAALASRLRRGDALDGFGHRLYPKGGDPRARILLVLLRDRLPRTRSVRDGDAIVEAVDAMTGDRPTIDFALVMLERALALPAGSALTLFALGRTIGWIGHAIEQYELNALIRPRAKYVGTMPA